MEEESPKRTKTTKSSFRQSAKHTIDSVISIAADSMANNEKMELKGERDSVISSSKSDPLDDELYNSHEEGKNEENVFTEVESPIDEILEVIEGVDLMALNRHPWRLHKLPGAPNASFLEASYDSDQGTDSDGDFEIKGSDLARAHWIQLHKTNKQTQVVQHTFFELLKNYKHLRPIWQFGRKIEPTDGNWAKRLQEDFYFRHHCASIQAAITMLMEHKDESGSIGRLLNELGAHHFFYDATESHFECFQSAFLEALRKKCVGVSKMDGETERSWINFITELKTRISEGIAIQRINYLRMAVTGQEIEQLRQNWDSVIEYGLTDAGSFMCRQAIEHYDQLLKLYKLENKMPEIDKEPETLSQLVTMTMTAFNVSIDCWTPNEGFLPLPQLLKDYVVQCMLLDVCPTLMRKAVQHGLIEMLRLVMGREHVSESTDQMWKKMYRVLEQSIMANIADY